MANITGFLVYISDKNSRTPLEERARQALNDNDFRTTYEDLAFLINDPQIQNVIENPRGYDDANNQNNYAYFQRALVKITNAYTSYRFDKKTQYSDLKKSITEVENRISVANKDIENINQVSNLVGGTKVLQEYAKAFAGRADDYRTESIKWMSELVASFLVLSSVVVLFFITPLININWFGFLPEDLKSLQYIAYIAFAIRILTLIALIQIVQFCYKNYNATKHLEHQTRHKGDVLNALFAVHQAIDPGDARNELIKAGALIAFQNTESGYITTKEGAGNTDTGLDALINGVFKK